MVTRRSCLLGFGALAVAASIGGCGKKETHSYRIGLGPWIGFGPLYLARQRRLLQGRRLRCRADRSDWARRAQQRAEGGEDRCARRAGRLLRSRRRQQIRGDNRHGDRRVGGRRRYRRARGHPKVADLRGKKVAFQRGLPSEFFLRALLLDAGMSLDDLQTLDMETAQAGAAFIAGQVDAAVVWEPWLTKAARNGGGHVLASTRDFPNLIVDVLAFNQNVVQKHPEDVKAIVGAILKAIDFHKQHPEEANQIMAPYFQVTPEKFASILEGVRFVDLERNRAKFGTPLDKGPIYDITEKASKIWLNAGVINRTIPADSIISQAFLSSGA